MSLPQAARLPGRVRMLALLDGVGTGAYLAGVSLLLARAHALPAVGLVLTAGSLGRLVALRWIGRLAASHDQSAQWAYRAGTLLMVFGSAAALMTAAAGWLLPTALLGLLSSSGNSLTSTLAATARQGRMVSFYPLLMVGGAAGSLAASQLLAAGVDRALPVLLLLMLAQLAEPPLIRPFLERLQPPPPLRRQVVRVVEVAAVATVFYGPLGAYAALVAAIAGEVWVGPAMAAYAAGALTASKVDALLSARLPGYAADRRPLTLLMASAALGTWLLAGSTSGLLAGRAAAGLLMFLVQGRLLRSAAAAAGSQVQVAAAATGLGLGAGAGGLLVTLLFEHGGTAGMVLTLLLLGLLLLLRR